MLNRIFSTTLISALFTAISVLPSLNLLTAIAQTPVENKDEAKSVTSPSKIPIVSPVISPSKRALIKELLEITESNKNARQVMESMVRAELPKLVSTILKSVPALDSDRPEVQKQFSEVVSRMAIKYRDRVAAKIDLDQLIEQVSYPIYDKYFTESELRDITSFYKSSTGKKAIAVLPQIVGDSMSRTNEILLPKMASIMAEVISEEFLNSLPKKK
ncbi:MAG: DUF2059 domain-containing protein [Pseudanabaena sp. CAN_BIN31]|nr:DUF2059 domain-containing protein [Pseudanabaena sp. CAN_BIN31]